MNQMSIQIISFFPKIQSAFRPVIKKNILPMIIMIIWFEKKEFVDEKTPKNGIIF